MSTATAQAPLRLVPTNVICGCRGAGKTAAILSLLARKPAGEHWAVLVNDVLGTGVRYREVSGPGAKGVSVRSIAGGCICCTARIGLRVALVELLRRARPQRLLVESAGGARLAGVLDVLRDPGLADALDLRTSICIADPRQYCDPLIGSHEIYREQLASAQVIVANIAAGADAAQTEALRRHAGDMVPPKLRFMTTRDGAIPLDLLDLLKLPAAPQQAVATGPVIAAT